MAQLWKDPRSGTWKLRRRIPQRYLAVSGRKGDVVKLTTGTTDRKAAERAYPEVLRKWADLEAEWERKLNVVVLTQEKADEVTARWMAWAQGKIVGDGHTSDLFEPLDLVEAETPERLRAMWCVIERHADEALMVTGITVTDSSRGLLLQTLARPVATAYLQADSDALNTTENDALRPAKAMRRRLPSVPDTPRADAATVSLAALYAAWKLVATVKPRVAADTEFIVKALGRFLGHDDAAQLTRDDMLRWRKSIKGEGLSNNTWNNKLSMVRQVFTQAVADGTLKSDPTRDLRLTKSRPQSPKPYTDAEALQILRAARSESAPSLRWAHWVMAFTGMRAGEVLQLQGRDVRCEGKAWFIDVNEDDETKSVKTSERRHVPIHDALVQEGFTRYAATVAPDAPLFPDKTLDPYGKRGGRAWNVVGVWVREKVGITATDKAPDHSWRHRMEDELRAAEVPEDVRDVILGHARRTTGRLYGVRGEALQRLWREVQRVPVLPGLFAVDMEKEAQRAQ